MIKEWLRNLSLQSLLAIVNDSKARQSYVWKLACAELAQRQGAQRMEAKAV